MKKEVLFRLGVLEVGPPDRANDDQPITHRLKTHGVTTDGPPEHLFFLRRLRTDSDGLGNCRR
jgi:hypothetical protein